MPISYASRYLNDAKKGAQKLYEDAGGSMASGVFSKLQFVRIFQVSTHHKALVLQTGKKGGKMMFSRLTRRLHR